MNGETLNYQKGQILYKEGMKISKMYIVLDGELSVANLKENSQSLLGTSQYFTIKSLTEEVAKLRN